MAAAPETRYAIAGGYHIAYQAFGGGPFLFHCEPTNNVDGKWRFDSIARALNHMSSFCTVVEFDPRGTGMSDPCPEREVATTGPFAADLSAVMDAVGADTAMILGVGERVPLVIEFAATHPERVNRLILDNGTARFRRDDDYLIGFPQRIVDMFLAYIDSSWGVEETTEVVFRVDEARRIQMARRARQSMAPKVAKAVYQRFVDSDVRHQLSKVSVPTLVMHRRDNAFVRPSHSQYLAEHIPGAQLFEYDAHENDDYFTNEQLAEIENFVTGRVGPRRVDRRLVALLRTDIVSSSDRAASVGDQRWRGFVHDQARIVTDALDRNDGLLVRNTGDGVIAMFNLSGSAIAAAREVRDEMNKVGLQIRSGVHVGEVDVMENDIAGIAVVVCTRLCEEAAGGEILVSSTVRDVASSSGVTFLDKGSRELKGVQGTSWVYAVDGQ